MLFACIQHKPAGLPGRFLTAVPAGNGLVVSVSLCHLHRPTCSGCIPARVCECSWWRTRGAARSFLVSFVLGADGLINVNAVMQIWDLESKSVVDELRVQSEATGRKAQQHYCVSVAWSADGSTLYGGYTDGDIRVWSIGRAI